MRRLFHFLIALSVLNFCGGISFAIDYNQIGDLDLRSDLNGDGYVGILDLALFCQEWLANDCDLYPWCNSDIYPFFGDYQVNMFDFNLLSQQWLLCIDPTNPTCLHKALTLKEPPPLSSAYAYPVTDQNGIQQVGGGATFTDNAAYGLHYFSGEFVLRQYDLRIRGRGLDFIWGRVYRSRTGTSTTIGNNWDYSYNIKIERSGAHIVLHSGNGRRDLYTRQSDGTWAHDGFFNVLSLNQEGTFTLTFKDTSTWNFLPLDDIYAPGKIITISDRNGNTITFDYDVTGRLTTVHDTLERPISVLYTLEGYIQSVVDFTGRTVTYQYYDGVAPGGCLGDLKSITTPAVTGTPHGNDFPIGKTTIYTYSTGFADDRLNHNLLTITDPRGNVPLTNIYSAIESSEDFEFDRVIRQVWGESDDIIDLVYQPQIPEPANHHAVTLTTINDRMGNVSELWFDNLNRLVIRREHTGRADPNLPTSFDPVSNPPTNPIRPLEDPSYFETTYLYNNDSLLTRTDYPNGNARLNVYAYDFDFSSSRRSRGNLREVHYFPGVLEPISDQTEIIEYYEYDGDDPDHLGTNFVTRYIDGKGHETNYEYDDHGNRLRLIHGITPPPEPNATEEWQYNAYGQITQHILPRNHNGYRRKDVYNYYGPDDPNNGYLKEKICDVNDLAITASYTYDSVGNLITQTDPLGNTTTYVYNSLDQIMTEISPAPFLYEKLYYYDENDNLIQVDLPASGGSTSTQYTFDILNRRTSMIRDAGGSSEATTLYGYDDNGNLSEITDPRNYSTITQYDERDLVYMVTVADGTPSASTQTYSYDQNGNIHTLYDGNGHLEFENIYDGYNRPISSTNELGYMTTYSYDATGNRTTLTNPLGHVTTYSYDTHDRLISQTDALGNITTYSYDPVGNRISETDSIGNIFTYEYDSLNRLIAATDPLGNVSTYSYDPLSNRISETDANGNIFTYEYDSLNRLVAQTDALGNITTYSYDPVGNRISETDSIGNIFNYEYDSLNRLVAETDPLGNVSTYSYDPMSNRISGTDANGNISTYSYDPLNRLITETDALGNTSTYSYDPVGNRISETNANGNITTYSYDPLNRIISATDPLGNVSTYSYDSVGNRISETDASGNITTYSYNPLNRIISKTDPLGNVSTYSYDPVGNRISETDANGNVSTYEYDSLNRLIVATDTLGNTKVYNYDSAGNRIKVTDQNSNITTYSYDPLNRLISENDALGNVSSYSYDPVGDRNSSTDKMGNTSTYSYDSLGRLISRVDPLGYTEFYSYDPVGNRISYTNKRGYTTAYSFDPLNRLVTETDPNGLISTITYDAVGNRTSFTDKNHNSTSYSYDALNRLIAITDPLMNFITYSYDSVGNRISETDKNGNSINYSYDSLNRLSTKTDPLGYTESYSYDPMGNRISETDKNDHTTSYTYDGLNRMISKTDPLGNTLSCAYDPVGNRINATDKNGNITNYAYDELNRLIYETDSFGNISTYSYDSAGNRISKTDANGNTSTYEYDSLNRLVSIIDPLGNIYTYSYDPAGNRISETDVNGNISTYEYDVLNRLVVVTDALGNIESYGYDATGNKIKVTDQKGNVITYSYDVLNRLTNITSPTGHERLYTYDNNGNIISKTDANGHPLSFAYDSLNRLITTSYPDGTNVTITYNPTGQPLLIANTAGIGETTTRTYDALNRLISETVDYGPFSKTLNCTYDPVGNRIEVNDPNVPGSTTYSYDALNRILIITDPMGRLASFEYDPTGKFTRKNFPNGEYELYHYDDDNQIRQITHLRQAEQVRFAYLYDYDAHGNLMHSVEYDESSLIEDKMFIYDPTHKLKSETYLSSNTEFDYDAAGNRIQEGISGSPVFYTYDPDDRLTQKDATEYYYDNNGNLVQKAAGSYITYYEYDYENRLVNITLPDARQINYAYNPQGKRIYRDFDGDITYYVYDHEDMVMELDEFGAVKATYTHGPGIDNLVSMIRYGMPYYYHLDRQGNVRCLTDEFENVINIYDYTAFGSIKNELVGVDNPYGFTGRFYDSDANLYFYRSRYYDPTIGRFISDEVFGSYIYTSNNPSHSTDPMGFNAGEVAVVELPFMNMDLNSLAFSPQVNEFIYNLQQPSLDNLAYAGPGAGMDFGGAVFDLERPDWTPPVRPDLVITDISFSPSNPIHDQDTVTISATVKNRGLMSARNTFYVDYNDLSTNSYLGSSTVNGLDGNRTTTVSLNTANPVARPGMMLVTSISMGGIIGGSGNDDSSVTVATSTGKLLYGDHNIEVTADSTDTINEAYENNNSRKENLFVTCPQSGNHENHVFLGYQRTFYDADEKYTDTYGWGPWHSENTGSDKSSGKAHARAKAQSVLAVSSGSYALSAVFHSFKVFNSTKKKSSGYVDIDYDLKYTGYLNLGGAAGDHDAANAAVDIKVFITDQSIPSSGADDMPHDVKGTKVEVYKKTMGGKSNFDIPNQSTSKKITDYPVNSGKTYYAGLRLAAWADAHGLGISSFSDFSSKNDSGYPYDGYARFNSMVLKLR